MVRKWADPTIRRGTIRGRFWRRSRALAIDRVQGTLLIEGGAIAYELSGCGSPLVLLHAGIADRRMWAPQIQHLSRHFRVLSYDLRGYGESGPPVGAFSHHDDLRSILAALGIARAHVLGLSMGASVALDFALTFPEMVDRLVVSSVLGPPPRSRSLLNGWAEAERAFERSGLPAVNEVEMRIWVDGLHRATSDIDPHLRAFVAGMNLPILQAEEDAEFGSTPPDPPAWERLHEIAATTLVITGDIDQPDVIDYTARLARDIPAACLEIVPGTAHMVNLEAPDHFNRLVVNFLTE